MGSEKIQECAVSVRISTKTHQLRDLRHLHHLHHLRLGYRMCHAYILAILLTSSLLFSSDAFTPNRILTLVHTNVSPSSARRPEFYSKTPSALHLSIDGTALAD